MRKICIMMLLVLAPQLGRAQIISELMYDFPGTDTKHEWIEVYNDSSSAVTVTSLKLRENDVNHSIAVANGTPASLAAGAYAVIADNTEQFLIDNPGFTGAIFDSAFSLNNEGEAISLVSGTTVLNAVSYTGDLGAAGDGNSLQFHEGIFLSAAPTPAAANATVAVEPAPEPSSETPQTIPGISSHDGNVKIVNEEPDTLIKIGAGRERLAVARAPVRFDAITNAVAKRHNLSFAWVFGDGIMRRGMRVEHTYKKPGTYNVILHATGAGAYAVSRTSVHVVEPMVEMSFSTTTDGYEIVLWNRSSQELNVGEYSIGVERRAFTFPKDTIISADQRIVLDHDMLGFSTGDISGKTAQLALPSRRTIAEAVVPVLFAASPTSTATSTLPLFHTLWEQAYHIKGQLDLLSLE